jgi:hypothetical protein
VEILRRYVGNTRLLRVLLIVAMLAVSLPHYARLIEVSSSGATIPWKGIAGIPVSIDFVNIYCQGILGRDARRDHINIYDNEIQVKTFSVAIAPEPNPNLGKTPFYMYMPPPYWVIPIPLTVLSIGQAWVFSWILGLALSLASLWYLLRTINAGRDEITFVMVGLLAAYPTLWSCWTGQPTLWVLANLVLIWALLIDRRYLLAGLATAVFTLKIQYTIPVIVAGLCLGRLRYLYGCAAGMTCALVICIYQLGLDNVLRFPGAISREPTGTISGVQVWFMQTLRGQLYLLRGRAPEDMVSTIVTVGGFILANCFIGYLWWHARRDDREQLRLIASLTTLLMLVVSLHTHFYDYVLIAIPAVWLWGMLRTQQSTSLSYVLACLLALFPLFSWIMQWRIAFQSPPSPVIGQLITWLSPILYSIGIDPLQLLRNKQILTQCLSPALAILSASQLYFLWAVLVISIVLKLGWERIKCSESADASCV